MAVINIINNNSLQASDYTVEDLTDFIEAGKKIYSTSNFYRSGSLEVYINGLLIRPLDEYSEILNSKNFILNIPDILISKILHQTSTLIVKYIKI